MAGVRRLNEVLSGSGGRVMLTRKIAEALKGKKIVLIPGGGNEIQKLDLNDMMKTYGLMEAVQPNTKAAVLAPAEKQASP